MRSLLRRYLPFRLRLELLRLGRLLRFLLERGTIARTRLGLHGRARYPFVLASHASPLMRDPEHLDGIHDGARPVVDTRQQMAV